jgi:D-alanyl-D-alanine carboxypeptidase
MIGTSANLNHKDIVNIYQLFHALMLPSGNDAAVVLAENFVSLLRFRDFLFT